jgi:hypothetical protein
MINARALEMAASSREGFDVTRYPDWLQAKWPSFLAFMLGEALKDCGGSMLALLKDVKCEIYNGNCYSTQIYAVAMLDWARIHHPNEHRLATGDSGQRSYAVNLDDEVPPAGQTRSDATAAPRAGGARQDDSRPARSRPKRC